MKLKNKKTGEIAISMSYSHITKKIEVYNVGAEITKDKNESTSSYNSLAELCEEWEDAPEEPKKYWHIFGTNVTQTEEASDSFAEKNKEIGNYFETKEEAEKAVEKLKAWKRLKDRGFEFDCPPQCGGLCGNGFEVHIEAHMPPEHWTNEFAKIDLDLLFFGGEE